MMTKPKKDVVFKHEPSGSQKVDVLVVQDTILEHISYWQNSVLSHFVNIVDIPDQLY